MKINLQKLCADYRIPIAPKNHQHYRAGWINISCPFCSGHFGYHLGLPIEGFTANCYRCGKHSLYNVIQAITGIEKSKIPGLIQRYSVGFFRKVSFIKKDRPNKLAMPKPITPLQTKHKQYLIDRNFDPDFLERRWDLRATNHFSSLLDGTNYSHRIIAPIQFKNRLVSFQTRDITNKQKSKYKACPEKNEIIPHKHILYGWDFAQKNSCVIVEGITDVWRLGAGALATFGVEFTNIQINLILSKFDRIFILFDSDFAGKEASDLLYCSLRVNDAKYNKKEVIIEEFPKKIDPADLSQNDANHFMKEKGL